MRLEGRRALVTGGGTGIGRGTAEPFAREGARVMVSGRRRAELEETVRLVEKAGGTAAAPHGPGRDTRPVETGAVPPAEIVEALDPGRLEGVVRPRGQSGWYLSIIARRS